MYMYMNEINAFTRGNVPNVPFHSHSKTDQQNDYYCFKRSEDIIKYPLSRKYSQVYSDRYLQMNWDALLTKLLIGWKFVPDMFEWFSQILKCT